MLDPLAQRGNARSERLIRLDASAASAPDQPYEPPTFAYGCGGISEEAGEGGGVAFLRFAGARFTAAFFTAFLAAVFLAPFFAAAFFTPPFFTEPLRAAFFATTLRADFFAAAFFAGRFLAADFFAGFFAAAFAICRVPLDLLHDARFIALQEQHARRYIRFAFAQAFDDDRHAVMQRHYRIIARAPAPSPTGLA